MNIINFSSPEHSRFVVSKRGRDFENRQEPQPSSSSCEARLAHEHYFDVTQARGAHVIGLAAFTWKAAMIINGTAALAVVGILGGLVTHAPNVEYSMLPFNLIFFAVGVFFAGLAGASIFASGMAHMTQRSLADYRLDHPYVTVKDFSEFAAFDRDEKEQYSRTIYYTNLSFVAFLVGVLLFFLFASSASAASGNTSVIVNACTKSCEMQYAAGISQPGWAPR